MTKIFHVFPFYSIKFAGGTSDLMHKICMAQKKSGKEPVILTGNYKIDYELIAEAPYQVKVFKSFLDRAGFSIMPGFFFYLLKNLKKNDIVHLHVIRTYQNLVVHILSLFIGFKVIIDAHGAVPKHKRKRSLKLFFDFIFGNSMMRRAEAIIAESDVGVTEYIDEYPFLDKKEITILSPPFDVSGFRDLEKLDLSFDLRADLNIGKDEFLITYLGRIHEIKGVDILIKFFADFNKSYKNSTLLIIGSDDGLLKECERLVKELELTRKVIFAGFMSGDQKNQSLKTSDCIVQLSRFEQGAWAPMEGILCGTPIIVSSQTGAGEDVARLHAGQTVSIESSEQFCGALKNILKDPKKHKHIALKTRDYIINYLSFEARIEEYYKIYGIEIR